MNYYVTTTGNDSNSGVLGDPFANPGHAAVVAINPGDVINIAAGTYNISSQFSLRTGVSMQGMGDTTILVSTVTGKFTILLESGAENTNGGQYLRSFKMDGGGVAYGAIGVRYRGNVNINLCHIVDFDYYGVSFVNGEPPSNYATNNKFLANIVTNCSGYYGGNRGCLEIGGQDGMEIAGNILNADRGGADCGDAIYAVEGFLKNCKIYNNTFVKTYYAGTSSWDFALELWNVIGGNEIYDNQITGSIDIVLCSKGSSSRSVWIHDNTIGQSALKAAQAVRGILFEYQCSDFLVERNLIQNVAAGIYLQQAGAVRTVQNMFIQSNIFKNIGSLVNSTGWGVYWSVEERTDIANNINVINNTFIAANNAYSTMYGVGLPDVGTATNVKVRNNIIVGFDNSAIFASGVGGTHIDTLSIENNQYYGNGINGTNYVSGMVPTNETKQNNATGDPLFVSSSDFHLQAASPCIGTGLASGLFTDYEGNAWDSPPSKGAYAYAGAPPPPPPLVPVTDITVTAPVNNISTQNGTAQCTASVLPLNASNPLVNWSISAGVGNGSVSPTGLLTALHDGSVTVRATAQDGSGIYGEKIFTITGQSPIPPIPTTGLRDRDGNLYNSVIIGSQEWIDSNFKSTHYADGTPIPNLTDCADSDYGALYNWFAASKGNEQNYGALYNFYAATSAKGIANTGWHVPTIDEWNTLETYLGGSSVAGGKLKEIGTTFWNSPNTGATNEVGFGGRGSGLRDYIDGTFTGGKEYSYFLTSSEIDVDTFQHKSLAYNAAYLGYGPSMKITGFPVRLIKDSTILSDGETGTYTGNDGKVYNTICIGTQEWFSENLDETKYADGDLIPIITDNALWVADVTGAVCWYNNNRQDIAPAGCHVPTGAEQITLLTFLDPAIDLIGQNSLVAGGYLKETGLSHWDTPNTGADNSSGFTALGGGLRDNGDGSFGGLKLETDFWASDEYDATRGNLFSVVYDSAQVDFGGNNKKAGQSIRCLVDDPAFVGTKTDIDGNVYDTVIIGTQCWLVENLKVEHYNDGSDISLVADNVAWAALTTGAYCYYPGTGGAGWSTDILGGYAWYDNLIANKDRGAFYNFYTIANLAYLEKNGVHQLGWRVPIQADFAGKSASLNLKEAGTAHWTAGDGLDTYGFKAIGAGIRDFASCVFSGLKLINRLWTFEAADASTAYAFLVDDSDPATTLDAKEKNYGFNVRLVRDYDPNNPDPPQPPEPPVPPYYPLVIPYNYGPLPVYRFYISTAFTGSALSFEVFPLKFLSSTIVSEKEKNEAFYRRKFSGSLLFGTNSKVTDVFGVEQNRRDDWLLFWGFEQIDPEEKLYLTITKDFGGFIETYWEGYFATSEGKFDIDNCTFEVTPLVIDDYTNLLDSADVEYNFLASDGVPAMGTVSAVVTAGPLAGTYNYTRMRFLCKIGSDNILEWLAKKLCGVDVVVHSDFFTAAINPVTLTANHLLHLTIAQKSDITRYLSTDPATTAMISWSGLMEILYTMFEVQWSYDLATKTITVEHIKEFTHPAGIDLRNQLSCVATNKYSYLKENMPKYESFSFMEASGVNFKGTPIYYDSGGPNQNRDSNSNNTQIPVTTDIEYVMLVYTSGANISDDGFVILCNNLSGGVYTVRGDFGRLDNSFYALNMDLSVANLQYAYHKYERVLPTGYMNGILTTFYSARKTKQQECTAILCEELDPNAEITTELGETYFGGAKAIVKSAALSPTGETKFQLLYGPLPVADPGVPDTRFGVLATPSLNSFSVPDDEVDIEFTFNIACPGNFNIRIREFVYDNTGLFHDVGAWENVTFVAGTMGYSFTPVYLHAIAAGWSVKLEFEYTGSEIDIFRGADPPPTTPFAFMYAMPYSYVIL